MEIPNVVDLKKELSVRVHTTDSSAIHYFISNSKGETDTSGVKSISNGLSEIGLTEEEILQLDVGANTLKVFASSEEALRPDIYETSFLVVEGQTELPTVTISEVEASSDGTSYTGIVLAIIGAIKVGIIVYIRRKRKASVPRN